MNDYLAKSAAANYGGAAIGAGQLCAADVGPKLTAVEEAIGQVELMRQQLSLISGDVAAFLDRAGGGSLNGIESEKNSTQAPHPAGQLPRLGVGLRELKYQLNTLAERVSKLNQIA